MYHYREARPKPPHQPPHPGRLKHDLPLSAAHEALARPLSSVDFRLCKADVVGSNPSDSIWHESIRVARRASREPRRGAFALVGTSVVALATAFGCGPCLPSPSDVRAGQPDARRTRVMRPAPAPGTRAACGVSMRAIMCIVLVARAHSRGSKRGIEPVPPLARALPRGGRTSRSRSRATPRATEARPQSKAGRRARSWSAHRSYAGALRGTILAVRRPPDAATPRRQAPTAARRRPDRARPRMA